MKNISAKNNSEKVERLGQVCGSVVDHLPSTSEALGSVPGIAQKFVKYKIYAYPITQIIKNINMTKIVN